MVSLLAVILLALMPFYSSQYSTLPPNEELPDLTRNKNKIYKDGKNEDLQFKSVSTVPDPNLKPTEINKSFGYTEAFVDSKTYDKQVRLISPFQLSEQKRTFTNWKSKVLIKEISLSRPQIPKLFICCTFCFIHASSTLFLCIAFWRLEYSFQVWKIESEIYFSYKNSKIRSFLNFF